MDYIRKIHWVRYQSKKCKMYLRNDFRFECAYCGLRESDNVNGEDSFEKDHFIPQGSNGNPDLDDYSNMVYACCRCNRIKTDQNLRLLLDPCKDDIYGGISPHILKTGNEGHYRLVALSEKGKKLIDSLQLNSRYYRKMRQRQTQLRLLQQMIDEKSDEFRCGFSKAGEELYEVLMVLKESKLEFELVLGDHDLDILLKLDNNIYACEVRVSHYSGRSQRGPRLEHEKRKAWQGTGKNCGILYYYRQKRMLELYILEKGDLVKKLI